MVITLLHHIRIRFRFRTLMIIFLARSAVGLTFPLFHARMQKTERANPNDQDRRRTDGTHGLARRGELTSGEMER